MGPRGRVALLLAGAVALAGAVVLLRQTNQGAPSERTIPPPSVQFAPTTVEEFADDVRLPDPGPPPDGVGDVHVRAGDRRLRVSWARAITGDAPRGAAGYEVRWGKAGSVDHSRLVAAPEVELRGLENGQQYDIEVRSADAFGHHSQVTRARAAPAPDDAKPLSSELTGLYDDFRGNDAPDPAVWAVQRTGPSCLRAGPGSGEEDDRLVLELRCGNTEAVLRARSSFHPDGGSGQISVVTDGPIPGGQLSITVVPGPVTALGLAAASRLPNAEPGRAVDDASLPPGTIRALVASTGAVIVAGPGVPRTAQPAAKGPYAEVLGSPGVTARWDLRFSADGVTLRRDDELAASADVLPNWQDATVLIGFAAPPGEAARLHVDAAGFSGPHADPPNVVDSTGVLSGDFVLAPTAAAPTRRQLGASPSAVSARLQLVMGPTDRCTDGELSADFEGVAVPLHPAVPGGAPPKGPYCPFVAQLTPELLDKLRAGSLHPAAVRTTGKAGVSVSGGVLEVTYPPGQSVTRQPATDPPSPSADLGQNRLAHLSAELRNAAGEPLVAGDPVPRGRFVLHVELDGLSGQRETGTLAGIAGIELRLDNKLVAGLPTTTDGPAPAGSYQFGLNSTNLTAGSHVLELRVLGADRGTRPRGQWLTFQVP